MATAAAPLRQPAPAVTEVAALPLPAFQRQMLMGLIMVVTLMQVLDSTIANVALPHMQGALGASPDSINWVLTSYIVAAAVATPVTGWLAGRFGRRTLLIAAVLAFTIASALCAAATSIGMMVASRFVQGMFGAFIMPLGQGLMLDINRKSRHAQALMLWGMVAMVGPVLGPLLGGWLTDAFSWRWVFLINVPIGIVATFGIVSVMPRDSATAERFDLSGFAFLFLAIAGLQLMLDRGSQNDWFDSREILVEAIVAVSFAWIFAVHTFTSRAPLLPVRLFGDRNLMLAAFFVLIVMGLLITSSAILPPMLQNLLGYDAYGAGVLTAPRGVGMILSMLVAGRLSRGADPRLLVLAGLVLIAASIRIMMGFSLDMDSRPVILSGLVQGFGFGFVVLPINLIAFATLDSADRTRGASLYALARNVGSSIAIALVTALLVRQEQVSHADLAAHITGATIPLIGAQRLGELSGAVLGLANAEVSRQAAMISYLDAYTAMFWLVIATAPLVLLMRPPRAAQSAEERAHAAAVE